jgi:hypothetical protein
MRSLAQTVYLDSAFGVVEELPRAGSTLENPFVYDAVARELKVMAESGLIEIVEEKVRRFAHEPLVDLLSFRRLR